ncbi:MAG: tRNA pseudouridine(55) synthase, partial [Lachnospiraceae bacterium]|nr:tRNA pseudouridine(55) synthase [Lachnospiraceae bacterium]
EDAYSLAEIETAVKQGNIASYVRPVETLFESDPALTLKAPADRFLRNGNALIPENFEAFQESEDGRRFRIRFSDGRFGALYRYSKESGTLLCVKMFLE